MKPIALLLEKLKEKGSLAIILLLGLAGVVLFVLGNNSDEQVQPTSVEEAQTLDAYIAALESRVAGMIAKIDGVSSVSVMLQPDGGEEHVYARNGSESSSQYVIIDGKNGDEALLVKRMEPKIRGAAVICKGGDDPKLQIKIVNLLCALFALQSNRVYVSG